MQATFFLSSPLPFSGEWLRCGKREGAKRPPPSSSSSSGGCGDGLRLRCRLRRSGSHGKHFNGRLVDENMVVLRKRIHESKAAAEATHSPPSAHWMEWEKRYHDSGSYASDVCEVVGWLQALMMQSRPSLVMGMMVLVTLSLSTSAAAILFSLTNVIQGFV